MVSWVDATAFIDSCCSRLHEEELVHGEGFSLFEAMVGILIGHDKMDIGLRREAGPSASELIAGGAAPLDLDPTQLEALARQLMQAEATWHLGGMLPTTVFTSLYMLDIPRLQDRPELHALCLSVQLCCTAVHDFVLNGHVCEDEDISIHTFGMPMLVTGGAPTMRRLCGQVSRALEGLEPKLAGLGHHLAFRIHFLRCVYCLRAGTVDALDEGLRHVEAALTELAALQEEVGGGNGSAASGVGGVAAGGGDTTRNAAEAKAASPSTGPIETSNGSAAAPTGDVGPRELGFVPGINLQAMGIAPPRMQPWASWPETQAHWRRTLCALRDTATALRRVRKWPALREALLEFAAMDSHALVRSVVYSLLTRPVTLNRSPPPAPAWCPTEAMVSADVQLWADKEAGSSALAVFLEQGAIALQAWAHTACLNRCRQRRRWRRALADWANMLDHAMEVQRALRYGPEVGNPGGPGPSKHKSRGASRPHVYMALAGWATAEAAGCALQHLMLGFPLELYAPHELGAVYWYVERLLPSVRDPRSGDAVAKLDAAACRAAVMLVGVLARVPGAVPRPPQAQNSDAEVWEQRFGALRGLRVPSPMTLEAYEAAIPSTSSQTPLPWLVLLAGRGWADVASNAGQLARSHADKLSPAQLKHLQGLKRIASMNNIAAQVLARTMDERGQKGLPFELVWDFSIALEHSTLMYFPALTLKRRK